MPSVIAEGCLYALFLAYWLAGILLLHRFCSGDREKREVRRSLFFWILQCVVYALVVFLRMHEWAVGEQVTPYLGLILGIWAVALGVLLLMTAVLAASLPFALPWVYLLKGKEGVLNFLVNQKPPSRNSIVLVLLLAALVACMWLGMAAYATFLLVGLGRWPQG